MSILLIMLEDTAQATDFAALLDSFNHRTVLVDSYPKAMQQLNTGPFHIILADAHLENGGTVFDFLRWVKSEPRYKEIAFVVVSLRTTSRSKYLTDAVRTTARFLGAAKYIMLDQYDRMKLLEELQELLKAE